MTDQHQKALAWMKEHTGEHEVPPGSNTGPFVRSCQAATWLGGTRWPWCVAACVKAWTVAGRKLPYRGAGAYAFLDWYRKHLPGWVVPLERARPGAMVVLNVGSGHMAMLERRYAETKPDVHTRDGNVSDRLAPRVRHHSLVRGVVDPPEDIGRVKPATPPVFEIVRSESGHAKVVFVGGKSKVARKLAPLFNRYGGLTVRRRKRKP